MNIILNTDNVAFQNIIFNEPIKNTVMDDSYFVRINYSNKYFIINGIYIIINIKNDSNKYKLLDNSYNIKTIQFVEEIEKYILNSYTKKKNHIYKIKDQLLYIINKSIISNSTRDSFDYILKISGIWETNLQIGITYKLNSINHL